MFRKFSTALLLLSCGGALQAHVLVGPFVPGTGSWNILPGGDFESGPQTLRAGDYKLSGKMFLLTSATATGTAYTDPVAAQVGSLGVVIQPGAFTGPGIGLTYDAQIPIQSGVEYVVSAFIRRPLAEGSLAHIYMDSGGGFERNPVNVSAATSGWQFVWGTFEASRDTTVTPRIVLDFSVGTNDVLYVDQFALTPYSQFTTPISLEPDQEPGATVPEPAVTWSVLGMLIPAFLGSRRSLHNRRA